MPSVNEVKLSGYIYNPKETQTASGKTITRFGMKVWCGKGKDGKNIYEFRISKNLSQGDLAELLDVSRQSVSKWETETAIPDLDKLMKMCDVFDVTLDELTGRMAYAKDDAKTIKVSARASTFSTAKIVGYILLATTLLASILLFALLLTEDNEDFYIFVPTLLSAFVCSMICLCVKNNIGYWCTWAILALLLTYGVCYVKSLKNK